MMVRQDRIGAELYVRDRGWDVQELASASDRVDIPGIGDIGSLGALCRDTPLFPG